MEECPISSWMVRMSTPASRRWVAKLLAKGERVEGPAWSPDGSKIAFVTGKARKGGLDRDIYVIDVPGD